MRRATWLTLGLFGCEGAAERTADDLPPPAPLVVPACAPGSAFELNGVAFTDLQEAFNAAIPGDTVVACAGAHTIGVVSSDTPGVTLAGETSDPADVTLTGGTLALAATLPPAPVGPTRLSGLTFLDASVSVRAPQVLARDLVFNGPNAHLSAEVRSIAVYRASFTGCEAHAALHVGSLDTEMSVTLDQLHFEANHVTGAVLEILNSDYTMASGVVRMRGVDLINNVSDSYSYGILYIDRDISVQLTDGRIIGNLAPRGGIIGLGYLMGPSSIRRWQITDNTSRIETLLTAGHGPMTGPLTIEDVSFLRNHRDDPNFDQGAFVVFSIRTLLSNVDFGLGPDNNLPMDITICNVDYGLIPSAVIRANELCPR